MKRLLLFCLAIVIVYLFLRGGVAIGRCNLHL